MKETADEDLMRAVSEGDLEAFNEIVLRYQSVAWKTAYRFLGDVMEAEDVAQSAFLKIFEAAPRYRGTASFRTFFYRILTNLCIDRTRKRQPTSIKDIPDEADPSPGPERSLIEKQRGAQVRDALETLPPNQKAAIILRHYEGLNYAEIAGVLGVTLKAVERLLAHAGASLKTRLSSL